jgi:hypothetical protein
MLPPAFVDDRVRFPIDEPERDLGRWTPERDAKPSATVVANAYGARRRVRALTDVALEDPRVAARPSLGAALRNGG